MGIYSPVFTPSLLPENYAEIAGVGAPVTTVVKPTENLAQGSRFGVKLGVWGDSGLFIPKGYTRTVYLDTGTVPLETTTIDEPYLRYALGCDYTFKIHGEGDNFLARLRDYDSFFFSAKVSF